jgi:glutaredoxin 3
MRAKSLLDSKGVNYTSIDIDQEPEKRFEMQKRSRRTSVPQIFIDDLHVGGFDDMAALDNKGELDPLLGLNN